MTLTDCLVERNTAQYGNFGGQGGGIYLAAGSLSVQNTIIDRNTIGATAADQGSAIWGAANVAMQNCLIYGNMDNSTFGSAIYLASGPFSMGNGTVIRRITTDPVSAWLPARAPSATRSSGATSTI